MVSIGLEDKYLVDYWISKLSNVEGLPVVAGRGEELSCGAVARNSALGYFNKVSKRNSLSEFIICQSIYHLLLSRYFGVSSTIIVTPAINYNRSRSLHDNTLFFKIDSDARDSMKDLFEIVKGEVSDVIKYEHYDDIYFKQRAAETGIDLLAVSPYGFLVEQSQFAPALIDTLRFRLHISRSDEDDLLVSLETDRGFITPYLAQQFVDHFAFLIGTLDRQLLTSLSEVDLLDQAEKEKILFGFNQNRHLFPSDKTIADLFEEQVRKTPNAVAVVYNGELYTYNDINAEANRLANYLQSVFSIGNDDLVAMLLPKTKTAIVAILGVLKAGAAYMPVDPGYPQDRILQILKDSQVKFLLAQPDISLDAAEPDMVRINLDEIDWAAQSTENPTRTISPSGLAYVIYTSGSTGVPKGVMIEHRSNVNMSLSQIRTFSITPDDKVLLFASLSFDASVSEIFMAFYIGATLVIPPGDAMADKDLLVHFIRANKVSVVTFPPSYLDLWNADDLKGIRCLITAGEPAHAEKAVACSQTLDYFNAYGPTECAVCVSIYKVSEKDRHSNSIPIGRPISNLSVYILTEDMQPVPVGLPGCLYVSGPGLARGYLHNPVATAERFTINPFVAGERLYDTGDVARWLPDGNLEFLGRKDNQVKIRGFRVEPGEIENVMLRQNEIVQQVFVDVDDVDGEKAIVAYLVVRASFDLTGFKARLQQSLPGYMLPAFYFVVDQLPVTSNGKVDRKALAAMATPMRTNDYVAPHDELEIKLAGIWEEILGCGRVGITDNFFDLGGHSLKMTQLANRVRTTLDLEISVKDLFHYPTIQALKEHLKPAGATAVIPVAAPADCYPLTSSQRRLWILSQFEGGSLAYNMRANFVLTGKLDTDVLQQAFDTVVAHHESLRTSFRYDHYKELRQYILTPDQAQLRLSFSDIQGRDDRENVIKECLHQMNVQVFDLEQAPLMRAKLLRTEESRYLLLFSMHHIIGDGWSLEILMRDIMSVYNSILNRTLIQLPALRIQFKDYAVWLEQELNNDRSQQQEKYWLEQLSGDIPILELPGYQQRPVVKTYNGATINYTFPRGLSASLKTCSEEQNVTLFTTLLAGLNLLFFRYTGLEDIIIGTPVDIRSNIDLENQVGLYLNTLAIRTRFDAGKGFDSLLRVQQETLLNAYAFQQYPFDSLMEQLQLERDTSRSALFDVMIVFQSQRQLFSHERRELQGVTVDVYNDVNTLSSQFDMTFSFEEADGELKLKLDYNSDIYNSEIINTLITHYKSLLQSALLSSQQPIGLLDYLSKTEQDQLLGRPGVSFDAAGAVAQTKEKARATEEPYGRLPDQSVLDLFQRQVKTSAKKPALVFEEKTITYEDLDRETDKIAHYLKNERGIGAGDVVGVLLDRSEYSIFALLAIFKTGACYLPLNALLPPEQIAFIIKEAGVKSLLTESTRVLPEHIDHRLAVAIDQIKTSDALADPAGGVQDKKSASYIIYTSGSTGQPKGVIQTHATLLNLIKWQMDFFGQDAAGRCLHYASFSFDVSLQETFFPLCAGGTIYLAGDGLKTDFYKLRSYITGNSISIISFPTSVLIAFFNLPDDGGLQNHQVKHIITAGEQLILSGSLEDFLKNNPQTKLHNHYGPSETHVVTSYTIDSDYPFIKNWVPIGKPLPGVSLYILDDHLRPVPKGVNGTLYFAGEHLALGYVNDEDLTRKKFVPDIYNPGRLMYNSGDVGSWMWTGDVEFRKRNDQQVKIRGYRVEPSAVESALMGFHEVNKAVVIVKKDNENTNYLVGYVEVKGATKKSEIVSYLRGKLPPYMIPAYLVILPELPVNSNGKIDKHRLPPAEELAGEEHGYRAPQTSIEKALEKIWTQVLGLKTVSATSSFFEIGGHSIKGVQVINRIYEKLGVKLDLQDIFHHVTIESLAKLIEGRAALLYQPIPQAKPSAGYALSHSQERMWVLNQAEGNEGAYNFSSVLILDGPLNIAALRQAFTGMISKYEILRTGFDFIDHEPVQVIRPVHEVEFSIERTSLEENANADRLLDGFLAARALQPFDLKNDSLIRVSLVKLPGSRFYLQIVTHYIVCDGWSLNIILKELINRYNRFDTAFTIAENPLLIQYKDYAEWQRKELTGPESAAAKKFWQDQLAGPLPLLGLQTDRPRPDVLGYEGSVWEVAFDPSTTGKIKKLCRETSATLFGFIFASVNALLHKYTAQTDIILGTSVSGRSHIDLEDQIGFFVNTLALRTKVPANDSFREFLSEAAGNISEAFRHGDYPFDLVVDDLKLERDRSRSRLFDVMVLLHNMDIDTSLFNQMNGITITIPEKNHLVSKFDLAFIFSERGEQLILQIEYNTALFNRETIMAMAAHFSGLVRNILIEPAARINDLAILPDEGSHGGVFSLRGHFSEEQHNDAFEKTISLLQGLGIAPAGTTDFAVHDIRNEPDQTAVIKATVNRRSIFPAVGLSLEIYRINKDTALLIPCLPLSLDGYDFEDLFIYTLVRQYSTAGKIRINKDFIVWQPDVFVRENIRRHKKYWNRQKEQLLTAHRERTLLRSLPVAESGLNAELKCDIREDKYGLSLSELLLITLLTYHQHSGKDTIRLSTLEPAPGAVFTLPGRIGIMQRLDGESSLHQLKSGIDRILGEISVFHVFPFERVKNDIVAGLPEEMSLLPDIAFGFDVVESAEDSSLPADRPEKIAFQFRRVAGTAGLSARIIYDPHFFEEETVRDMRDRFLEIAGRLRATDSHTLRELSTHPEYTHVKA